MNEFIEKLIGELGNEMKYCQFKAREARKKRTQNLISEEKLGYKQAQCFDTSIQIVKALAKALVEAKEYKGGWIPCSERLPEADGWVLTCDKEGNIHIFFYANGYFCESFGCRKITEQHERFYVPIAWQPLPEPYRESAEKN